MAGRVTRAANRRRSDLALNENNNIAKKQDLLSTNGEKTGRKLSAGQKQSGDSVSPIKILSSSEEVEKEEGHVLPKKVLKKGRKLRTRRNNRVIVSDSEVEVGSSSEEFEKPGNDSLRSKISRKKGKQATRRRIKQTVDSDFDVQTVSSNEESEKENKDVKSNKIPKKARDLAVRLKQIVDPDTDVELVSSGNEIEIVDDSNSEKDSQSEKPKKYNMRKRIKVKASSDSDSDSEKRYLIISYISHNFENSNKYYVVN